MATVELFEWCWLILSGIALSACLRLMVECRRDLRTVRKHQISGPVYILANNACRSAVVRLVIALLLCGIAMLYAVSDKPLYRTFPQFRFIPYAILLITALFALNVGMDSQCRAKLQTTLRALAPDKRNSIAHQPWGGTERRQAPD